MIKKHPVLVELESLLQKRILILDGAMGSMLQQLKLSEAGFRGALFAQHPRDLKGNHDVLSLTLPEAILKVHRDYIEAGADLIETNTFNGTRIAQSDYGLEDQVYAMNLAAARLTRRAADEERQRSGRRIFVAGAMGPTNKTLSISPDVSDPALRTVSFDQMAQDYLEQARALLEGGCDLLLPETVFDTLNLKACLFAIQQLEHERCEKLPVIVSVTISDRSGRTLTGQTLEAFLISIGHLRPLAVGLNCALGGQAMRPLVQEMHRYADCYLSCYPNAGLPNPLAPTGYDETPESFAACLKEMGQSGLLNIAGGCCGTTPEHIRALSQSLNGLRPREVKSEVSPATLALSGLEPLRMQSGRERPFYLIGERSNVTGSPKFAKAVKAEAWPEALQIVRQQILAGANLIDFNFDEALLDGPASMQRFVRLVGAEPDLARIPVVIDSSDWKVIEAGLKNSQGRCLVNSISLKDGEVEFLARARMVKELGAACIVMAFDESGQATDVQSKVRICLRAYRLLREKLDFPAEDIVFDPNVLAIATGISEHDNYGKDFIESIAAIKAACPEVRISGGVSNLSFSFRGQNRVREAMHTVFLYHAIAAGLDMAIVNAGMIQIYENLDPRLRELCEDVVLNRRAGAAEELLAYAEGLQNDKVTRVVQSTWRQQTVEQRLAHALINGLDEFIEADTLEALNEHQEALAVIEGPLMAGMSVVGELFGQGKMFLPQVVKSARVMKKAVAALSPYMKSDQAKTSRGKFVLATVKGDVHDIGKNIVAVILNCNGYEVMDLGVMVSADKILDTAEQLSADYIGLSGLITPSLEEMAYVAARMRERNMRQPLFVGGATTSLLHTAVKIAPNYSGATVHVRDASLVMRALNQLRQEDFVEHHQQAQEKMRQAFLSQRQAQVPISLTEARARRPSYQSRELRAEVQEGVWDLSPEIEEVIELIDWSPFFWTWGLKGKYPAILEDSKFGEQARKLHSEAKPLLIQGLREGWLERHVRLGVFSAHSRDEDVILKTAHGSFEIPFLRQQPPMSEGPCYCLADFVNSEPGQDHLGVFVVSAGERSQRRALECGDDYHGIMIKALADRVAEALAEWAHREFRRRLGIKENLSLDQLLREEYVGIRPAPGYPACPDHKLKEDIWNLLGGKSQIGVSLTESLAMDPPASVAGFMLAYADAKYFQCGPIGEDQLSRLAQRRQLSMDEMRRWVAFQ